MAKTADEIRKEIERINASKKSSNTSSASASNASTSKTKTKADAIQERLDELNSRTPQQQQRSQFWNYGLFGLAPYIGEGTYRTDPTGNTEKFYGYGGGITELTPDSVQDQAAKQLTGHKTALTDYGANVPIGTVANRIANYRSTLATAGLALGGLFHGDNHYEPEQGSTLWKMLQASSASSRQANDILQAAKEGRGWVGSTIADVESSAIDVAIDSIYSMMGGSSMAPMTVRSFGSASQQARDEGKSISTQLITGAKSAAIEYFTEKMWGIGGRKIEGGGYIEALTKRWGNNLIERGVPAIVEKMAAAFGSEAVEEMMSDVLNALFDKGFASISQRLGGDYEYSGFPELTEILHDGLVGGLVGLGGGTSEGISAQRSINQNGKSSWIRAQREANQINADQSAMEKFKKKLTTKKGKAEFGPLFKRSIARHFAAERGITAANEVANDFFKAYNQVKAEEFENPEKALEKIIEKYNEIRVEKDIKPNAKPRAEGARPIGYGYSEEQINQFKQGVEPEQQAAAPQPQADENRGNGMPEQGKPNYDRNHSIDSIAEAWDGSRSATEFLGKLGYSSEEINQLIDESDSVFDLVQKLGLSNDDIDFLTDYLELGDDYESVSVSEWLKNKYARSQNLETVEKAYVETSSGMEFLKALGYSEAEATEILSKVSVQNPLGDIFKMIGMRESQINSFMEDLESVDEDQERPSSGEWLKKGLSNETVRDNDSGRVQNEAKVGREESENGGVRQDNGQTLNEESRSNERSSEQAQRQSAEAEEQRKPSNRIYSQKQLDKLRSSDAVGENINRRHGEIASGEVNQEKSSARLGYARQIAQKANVDEATLDHILDGMLLRGWRDVYDYIANGQIESSGMDADEFNDYYRGLAAQQLLMDISEGNLPSVLDDLKTLGVDEKTAKDYLAKMRDALKADGMYNESNEARSAEADKKYNPYATVSATTADNKGKNNLTSTIGEMNADIGDAQTVGFERAKFEQQANDTLIREFTMKKQRGSGKNRLFNNEKHKLRLYQRGESTFILVNEDGRIVGTYDEIEKAYVAAKGTGDQYQEVRIKLGSGAFGEFVHGQYRRVGVDFGKVFTQENYEKSQNGDDKNAAVRFITRIRSHASDLADVKYDTWTDAKTTTDMLTIDLSGVDNMYSITNLLKQIIDLSSEGKGIQGSNGKTYIFAGQSASQRKNGTIQLMEKSAYEAVRDTMRGYAVKDGDVDKFNPAKYLANVGFMFTPSNNDTGVKLADCVVLPDVYEMRFNVLNWYMVTDIAKDEAELTSRFKKSYEALKNKDGSAKYTKEQAAELAAQKAKGYLANAKVGFPIEILTDVVMANSTDGTGFIWSDKRESFQMRSVGGVKGLLQSMDFYKYLQDNLPAGDQATPPDTAQYFYKTSDGEVWAKTVWGNWVNLRGKKALLFNSTVKFADKFTIKNGDVVDGEASYKNFIDQVGKQDLRSIPKENVYGSNNNAGMVDGMKKVGLMQVLRNQLGFSRSDIVQLASENVYDVQKKILSDNRLMAKMFGVDFDSDTISTTSIQSVVIKLFGANFFETPLGQKWAVEKLNSVMSDFKGAKMYFDEKETSRTWIVPDVVAVFNRMADINFEGYKGLAGGRIYNGALEAGATMVGRNPSAESNDVQVRINEKNEAYAKLVERYGMDQDMTYRALQDQLELNLDNDYDGDTVILVQGTLAKMLERISWEQRAKGRDVNRATEFTHSDPTKDYEQAINSNSIIGVIRMGLDADKIGIFDRAVDNLLAFSDAQLEPARQRFNKENGTNYDVDTFRDVLCARFAVAYKLNIDYAKYGYYPQDFKTVVNQTLEMLDYIAYENGYVFTWQDKDNKDKTTHKWEQAKVDPETGRRIKDLKSAQPTTTDYQESAKAGKRAQYAEAAGVETSKRKMIMREGKGLPSLINHVLSLDKKGRVRKSGWVEANKNWLNKVYESYRNARGGEASEFALAEVLAPMDTSMVTKYLLVHPELGDACQAVMAAVNETYYDKKRSKNENIKRARKMMVEFQKSLNLDAEQFATLMLVANNVTSESTGIMTLLNLNQRSVDESMTGITTQEAILRKGQLLVNMLSAEENYTTAALQIEEMKGTIQGLEEQIAKARADYNMETPEVQAKVAEMETAIAQIKAELDVAMKGFSDAFTTLDNYVERVKDSSVLSEKILKNKDIYTGTPAEVFENIKNKIQELYFAAGRAQARIDELTSGLSAEEAKKLAYFRDLTDKLLDAIAVEQNVLPGLEDALTELKEYHSKEQARFEREYTRAELYGYNASEEQKDIEYTAFSDAIGKSRMFGQMADLAKLFGDKDTPWSKKVDSVYDTVVPKAAPKQAGAQQTSQQSANQQTAQQETARQEQTEDQGVIENRKEAWKRAVRTFKGWHGLVSDAAERAFDFKTAYHDDAENTLAKDSKNISDRWDKVVNALVDVNNGVTADMKAVIEAYGKLKGTRLYSEDVAKMFQEAEDLRVQGEGTDEADMSKSYANAIYNATMYMQTFAEHQDSALKDLKSFGDKATKVAKNFDKSGVLTHLVGKALRWQATSPTMWKFMGGFDSDSFGYKMSNRIQLSTRYQMQLFSRAQNFFLGLAEEEGYQDLVDGKTKVSDLMKSGYLSGTEMGKTLADKYGGMSAMEAIYMVNAVNSLDEARGFSLEDMNSPYYNKNWIKGFVLPNGKVIKITNFDEIHELSNLIQQNATASKYSDAVHNMFASFGPAVEEQMIRSYGFAPAFYSKGNYVPLSWAAVDKDGNAVLNKNKLVDSWDLERQLKSDPKYTLARGEEVTGYLNIVPMTEAIDAYAMRMSDWLAFKELRDELSALNTKSEDGYNLADVAGENFGSDFGKWVNGFVDDVTKNKDNNSFFTKLRVAMEKGTLIGNPSTIMKQSSSYWSAAGILSMDSLIAARSARWSARNAGQYTDEIRFRSKTKRIDPTVTEIMDKNDGLIDKILNKMPGYKLMTKGITWMDKMTVNNLFVATVYDCIKNHEGNLSFDYTSQEFIDEVESKFDEVVMYTQPMFQTILRAEYSRTSREEIRMLSMFRTQQTQNLNRLITTIGEYNNAKATGQDTAEYAKALRQTIVGQGAAAVSLGILTVIGDLLRHKLKKYRDDDDEFDVTKLFTRAGLNTLEAAGGTLWFGDELIKRLVDIASGGETKESYGISMSFITQLNGLHDAVTSFAKDRSVSSARYAAGYIAQLAGIPLNNAYSYLNSAATYIADWTGNNEYHLDDIIKIAEKNSKVSKEMEAAHEALVGMGFTKKEATDYLKGLDTSKNGKISQDEIKELYYTNPEAAGILQAIWDTNEWSKDFDTMAAAVDKERQYNSNPLYAAVDANKDKKVSQKEIVNYAMSHEDEREGLESLWNENEWSTDFEDAMDAAQNKRTKEAIKTAFENDDYNVLFETVKDYDGGEAYLAKLISKATGDRTSTNSELILGYLQKTNLSAQAFDEAVELYAAKKMVPLYTTLRNAGVPTKQALTTVYALDANSNSSISQDEFLEYYRAHPNDEALVEELWNSMGYSGKYTKDWKTYKKHNKIS